MQYFTIVSRKRASLYFLNAYRVLADNIGRWIYASSAPLNYHTNSAAFLPILMDTEP
jgi:hypothetical protein